MKILYPRCFALAFALVTITGGLRSQNLVVNPSFESYTTCPVGFSQFNGYINNWFSPNTGSPDYYNACAVGNPVQVPGNSSGYQPARTGNAYIGMYTGSDVYREYVQVALSSPLVANTSYTFSMYVSLADNAKYAIDDLGAYISVNPPYSTGNGLLNGVPQAQISSPAGVIISDTLNWLQITGTYIATGGEQYITIGHFKPDSLTNEVTVNYGHMGAYYFYDDISLIPSCCTSSINFINVTQPSCNNAGAVTANLNSSCSASAQRYHWSTGDTIASLTSIASGNYTITITDNSNCSTSSSININGTTSLPTALTTAVRTTCGNNNGIASVTTSGGTGSLKMHWNTNDTTASIQNLAAGVYSVTVTDSTGCSVTANVTVDTSHAIGQVNITADRNNVCPGDSVHLCTDNYTTYLWNTGATTQCINVAQAGNYYATVTDTSLCVGYTAHHAVNILPITPLNITVNGDTLRVNGGLSYQWYLNNQLLADDTASMLTASLPGKYVVVLVDTNGCAVTSNAIQLLSTDVHNVSSDVEVIYPNPSNGTYNIRSEWLGSNFQLFDIAGQIIDKGIFASQQIALPSTAVSGLYFLKVFVTPLPVTIKLIKQ